MGLFSFFPDPTNWLSCFLSANDANYVVFQHRLDKLASPNILGKIEWKLFP